MFLDRVGLLVKFAHMRRQASTIRAICFDPYQSSNAGIVSNWEHTQRRIGVYISRMVKKSKPSMTAGRATVASIHKEMQKPRLTASVRSAERDQAAPVAKQPRTGSGKAQVSQSGAQRAKAL